MNQLSPWSRKSIVYHIYLRSFYDSNNDGIGDIQGLIQKIDYLKDLGITAIWLSPIYPSPQVDFGYDVSDYINIDPVYGTLADFDELITKLHQHGIKLLMDYVPNHTSDQHAWFQESRSSKNNSKREWYIWADPKPDGSPPNNWIGHFGGSGWEFDNKTKQYYFHSFDKHQPDLNWRNPEVVKAMLNVLRFWLDRGVDGFRVDVIKYIFKDSLLRDEPLNPDYRPGLSQYKSLLHIYSKALPEYKDMIKQYITVLKEYGDKFLVTEATMQLDEIIEIYKTIDWKYYTPFNFAFITMPWDTDHYKPFIDAYLKGIGTLYLPNFVLGNHDKPRVGSRIGTKQARIAAMLQLTLPGIPFIYYGEEIGMVNSLIPKNCIQDTYELTSPGLNLGRDPERTPMQWTTQKNAGFSETTPWLPVNENYQMVNVIKEKSDSQSFFSLYKGLIKLRKTNNELRDGDYVPLSSPAKNVLAFLRKNNDDKVLILLNFDDKEKVISLPYQKTTILYNASLTKLDEKVVDLNNFILQGDEGYILKIE